MKIKLIFYLFIFTIAGFSQNSPEQKRPKIGLVLSGGGAKGFAHIETLKAIEKAGIKLDYISGTSMGAIVGGLYASGYNAQQLDSILRNLDFEKILLNEKKRKTLKFNDKEKNEKYILEIPLDNFKIKIPSALSKGQGTLSTLSKYLRHINSAIEYKDLPIPFLCIATNIETGESVELTKGFLPKSILASSSFPLLLKPVEIDNLLLSDGGLINNYPAKELKNKGIDVLIGVNVSKKLATRNELKSANQILEQISYYQVIKGVEEQQKFIDIEITPFLDNFSVTDFDKKDSILAIGRIAVNKVSSKLDSLAKIQGLNYHKPKLITDSDYKKIKIDKIIIIGNKLISTEYITNKITLNKKRKINYNQIDNAIDELYSTGLFDNISYYLENLNNQTILNINVIENNEQFKAKLSMNYNDVFKTGVLINLSKVNLFVQNSKLSFDFVLGDKLRYYFDYYIDNGIIPSVGLSHSLINYPYSGNDFSINSRLFTSSIYFRSTIKEKFATEIGLEHFYSHIKEENKKPIQNDYYLIPYGSIKIDTRDDNYFPKEGLKMKLLGRYNLISNQNEFKPYLMLNGNFEYHFPLNKNLTFSFKSSLGSVIGEPTTELFKNRIGGVFNQEFLNFEKFYGYKFDEIQGNYKFILGSELRYEFYKKHNLSLIANYLNMEDEINKLKFFKFDYNGFGLGYGYNSPIGPLQFFYSYSPLEKTSQWNFNLGYTF